MDFAGQIVINGLVTGSVYALVALGIVLIYKSSDAINFAQGEFMLLGAYLCLYFIDIRFPFFAALMATLLVSFALGYLVEKFILRHFLGESVLSIIMASIALSALLGGIIHVVWGAESKVFPSIFPSQPFELGEVKITYAYLWAAALVIVLLIVFFLFFKYTKWGIAMRATADDQQASMSMGINVRFIFAMTWAIAAMVAAVGGILLGNINGINMTIASIGLKVLPVALLGGLDSVPGAIVGGLIIGLAESLTGAYIDPLVGGGVKDVVPYILLLLILMIRPYGLFGKEEIERV